MATMDELTHRNVEMIAKMERAAQEERTPAARFADRVAQLIGSWGFLLGQTACMALYITLNVVPGLPHWDPYPFILLNLVLAFEAAYMGPVIMMSQNRQARVNERRNHLDLQINLLSEQENTEMLCLLRKLCEKAGVDSSEHSSDLAQPTEAESLLRQIQDVVEKPER